MIQIHKFSGKSAIVSLLFCLLVFIVSSDIGWCDPPEATINSPNDGATFDYGDNVLFSGSGTDPDGDALLDLEWYSDKDGHLDSGNLITVNDLTSGTHTIQLISQNDGGPQELGTDSITITINNIPPVPTITAPTNGTSFTYGNVITFTGSVTDAEDTAEGDTPTLSWSSSLGDPMGTGTLFATAKLSSGTHVITLEAKDNGSPQNTGTTTITITVMNTAPAATITAPADGSTFDYGTNINFNGTGSDAEDFALSGTSLAWSSSQGDPMGTGSPYAISTLSSGTHTITLTVTDNGVPVLNDIDTITITVNNAPPVAKITSPASNSAFDYGTVVTLVGTGADVEDGTISGTSLAWTSDIAGPIGTGETLPLSALASGNHTIILTVTDSEGDTDTDTISITINNTPPVVTIDNPSSGQSFYEDESISFAGSGVDPEEGALTGAALVWRSSLDGQIGTGAELILSTLSSGNHTITLTATDSKNMSASTNITLKVGNDSPVATITAPYSNSSYDDGVEIIFQGKATDTEDGTLDGTALVWTSNKDGQLGTGPTVTIDDLHSGIHIVTLTATDTKGAVGKAEIQISINNNPPVVTINSPENNATFNKGTEIFFNGSVTDVEDGMITGKALTWTSNRDGIIGYGTTLTKSNLTKGDHLITLTALDSQSIEGSASITISTGNIPPTAYITNPVHKSTFQEGELIYFSGSAADDKDLNIIGTALQWASNNNGRVQPIGIGRSFSTSSLDPGTHTITLTVKDSEGAIGTTTIILSIIAKQALSVSPTNLTLGPKETGTIGISGGEAPYRVFSKYVHIAKPVLMGTTITVTGLSEGMSELTITDSGQNSTSALVTVTDSPSETDPGNSPTADAGPDQTVVEGVTVTLDGSASSDSNSESLSYVWRQTGESTVSLSNSIKANPTFVAPKVGTQGKTLTFELTVTNSQSGRQDTDTVSISVSDNGLADFGEDVLTVKTATDKAMGIEVDETAKLTRMDTLTLESIEDTEGKPEEMPYGLIDFDLKLNTAGETATMIIYLPEAAPAGYKWFKYNATTGWIDFSRSVISDGIGEGAEFNDDRTKIMIYMTDDSEFDDDKSDAVISDPSGLGKFSEEDSKGGGGCYIFSIFK